VPSFFNDMSAIRTAGPEFAMTMQHAVRKVGDVTVLDLSGRISLGEKRRLQSRRMRPVDIDAAGD
jgi:hypothetical protein